MNIKDRTCKVCRKKYKPWSTTQKVCSTKCAIILTNKTKTAKAKQQKKAERLKKEALRPRKWYIDKAQAAINGYVRERDYGLPCICCGRDMSDNKYGGIVDASHYRSRGSSPDMRFCLNNIFAGCVKCNRFLSGSVTDMRLGMISRIGLEKVEAVENDHENRRYDVEYLKRMARVFRKKTRMLKKRRK